MIGLWEYSTHICVIFDLQGGITVSADPIWQVLLLLSMSFNVMFCFFVYRGKLPEKLQAFLGKIRPIAREKTKDKMLAVMEEGERKGCIKSTERKLVENVFEFKEQTAADLMIHRRDVVMLSQHESHEEILHQIIKTGRSRFPVYGKNTDDVVGILSTRRYLLNYLSFPKKNTQDLLYAAYFVPSTLGAEQLLRDMQSRKVHIAILVDEYGGVAGIVTLEDLLEEIVGNIYDEFDPQDQEKIIPIAENLWRVAGNTEMKELATALGLTLPKEDLDFDTISGLVFQELDIIPDDDSFPRIEAMGLLIQVEQIINRRIMWLTISLQEENEENQEYQENQVTQEVSKAKKTQETGGEEAVS